MSYARSGVFLLKRWVPDKGVEHYAVGVSGTVAWRIGSMRPTVIQLLPNGLSHEAWNESQGWEILRRSSDEGRALTRLASVRSARYAVFGSNCEHFARYVVTGIRESRQVQGAAVISLLLTLALFRK